MIFCWFEKFVGSLRLNVDFQNADKGLHGFVFNQNGQPLEGAVIDILEIGKGVHTDENGDYWRPLLEGTYTVQVSMDGFVTQNLEVDLIF